LGRSAKVKEKEGGFIFNLVFLGREILGSHGGNCEDYRPLENDAIH
jgi:hypothetical protein